MEAKKGELIQAGLPDPSPSAVRNSLAKESSHDTVGERQEAIMRQ